MLSAINLLSEYKIRLNLFVSVKLRAISLIYYSQSKPNCGANIDLHSLAIEKMKLFDHGSVLILWIKATCASIKALCPT